MSQGYQVLPSFNQADTHRECIVPFKTTKLGEIVAFLEIS